MTGAPARGHGRCANVAAARFVPVLRVLQQQCDVSARLTSCGGVQCQRPSTRRYRALPEPRSLPYIHVRARRDGDHQAKVPHRKFSDRDQDQTETKKRTLEEMTMAWTTPTLVEICIGLEINGYLPAEF